VDKVQKHNSFNTFSLLLAAIRETAVNLLQHRDRELSNIY
jgi:hypothetical protein